jgi:hypothetical protein
MRHRHDATTRTDDPTRALTAHVGALADDGYRRNRDADLARILGTVREPVRADRRLTRRSRRPVLVLAGTVAAAAVVAGLVAVPGGGSGHEPVRRPPASPRVLDARSFLLASANITAKAPASAHGNYWYSQIREVERARQPGKRSGIGGSSTNGAPRSGPYFPFHAYVSVTWENWDPYEQGRPSRTVDRDITPSFATPADKAAWQRAGSPSLTDMKPFSADSHTNEPYLELGPRGTTMADLPKLPVTAAGLEKLVRADRARTHRQLSRLHATGQQLSYLEDVYNAALAIITSPAPPEVRAAAYRMLAEQRSIQALGNVRDGLGRPGVALAVPVRRRTPHGMVKGEEHLIVDPGSAEVLAREFYPIERNGTVASAPDRSTLMISAGWTDRIGVPAP